MLQAIVGLLKDFETLIYKILMWLILVPKTLVMIILDPRKAAKYVQSELNDGKAHFDEYVSPVILLLMVALLPSLGYNVLPEFGAKITSPAETEPTMDRIILFDVSVDFVSASPELDYIIDWEVWRKSADGGYEIESFESHPRDDGSGVPEKVDDNTINDKFLYTFSPGEYLVYIHAINVKSDNDQYYPLEDYESYITVIAPVDTTAHMKVFSESSSSIDEKTAAKSKKFLDQVKEEQTIYLALGLMIPPLLFAFATRLFKSKMEMIGSESLLESFYVQCYYFSPLGLAVWGTYYAYYFFTEDAYFYIPYNNALQFLLLPLVWAALWFVRTEIKRIIWELTREDEQKTEDDEKEPEKGRKPLTQRVAKIVSVVVVIVCFAIIGFGVYIIVNFESYMDDLRLTAIRLFPILTILLILGFAYSWFTRRKDKEEKVYGLEFGMNVTGLVVLSLVFFGIMNLISGQTELASPVPEITDPQATIISESAIDAVSTPAAPSDALAVATSTTTPLPGEPSPVPATPTLASSPYFTEEFNILPTSFFDFMTFGDPRMVKEVVDLGTLSIGLTPLEDKYSWYYLINNDYSYSSVRVEAVVTNQGNNANGISLICQYSSIGWYEVMFSSSGIYKVFVVDSQGIANQGYNEIANGGSGLIKTGLNTNVYAVVCNGNELTLYVNNVEEDKIKDTIFRLPEGKVGIAVSSPLKLPVSVAFESLTVSQP